MSQLETNVTAKREGERPALTMRSLTLRLLTSALDASHFGSGPAQGEGSS